METTISVEGYECQVLYNQTQGTPIVFLHGLSYDIEIWQRLGVLDLLLEKKIPFLAIDMPYGEISQCHPKTRDPKANTVFIAEALQNVFPNQPPLIVGASIGGYIALNYAAKNPVKGLLLAAPAYAFENMTLVWSFKNFHFPVRIIWGTNDTIISSETMRTLVDKLPSAKMLVYNNASHSAYKDQPEWFKTDLIKLYAIATT